MFCFIFLLGHNILETELMVGLCTHCHVSDQIWTLRDIQVVNLPTEMLHSDIKFWSTDSCCPTRYQTQHFFNNFTTNEDITMKFEADLPHCVINVTTS